MSNCPARRLAVAVLALAGVAAAPPSKKPAGAASDGRSTKQIGADLQAVAKDIQDKRHPNSAKYNPLYRQQMAAEYGPLYERERSLLTEWAAAAAPKAAAALHHLATVDDARLAFWQVAGAADGLDAAESDPDKAVVTDGKLGKLLARWWSAYGDADAQSAVVTDLESMVAAAPTSGPVADAVHEMLKTNPASVAVGQRLTADLTVKMARTPAGKAYAAVPNKIDEPLAVDRVQLNGKPFHSKDWAGKVVMVDFWATWCGPCKEEIPHVAKVYQQYHDQGFEIVGVSSDNDKRAMADFLKAHPEMPWTELFGSTSGWHPLTKKFGIGSIPTMYLLDRQGNLRSVEGREEMDKLIPTLLAEAYTPAAAKPTAGQPVGAPGASGGRSATPPGSPPMDDINALAHRAAAVGGMH